MTEWKFLSIIFLTFYIILTILDIFLGVNTATSYAIEMTPVIIIFAVNEISKSIQSINCNITIGGTDDRKH